MTLIDLALRMKLTAQRVGRIFPVFLAAGALTCACSRSNWADHAMGGAGGASAGGGSGNGGSAGGDNLTSTCGDGAIDPGEECDSFDVGGATCESLGLGSGPVYCNVSTCTFDTQACETSIPACGDGILDWESEECDGQDVGGADCGWVGLTSGRVSCYADSCRLNFDDCWGEEPYCGDGWIDTWEECEGDNLAGATCDSLGFDGGQLRCSGCFYNIDLCAACGDGRVDPSEECEADWLGGQTCHSLGYTSGVLACGMACEFDVNACATCGNGIIEAGETCDGNNFQGESCGSLGLGIGALACSPNACKLITNGCTSGPWCGNGVVEVGEDCDGGDLAGLTCQDLDFDGGTLACNTATCRNNVSGCVKKPAGDCINECNETQCSAAQDACDGTEGCEEVLDCLDACHDNPDFGCASNCAGDLSAAAIAVILSDCLSDCAVSCSGG